MTTLTLPPEPTPAPSQNQSNFNGINEAWLVWWRDNFVPEMNTVIGEIETTQENVETIAGGLASLFIQDTEPTVTAAQYLWLDTSGPNLVLYFEDGL